MRLYLLRHGIAEPERSDRPDELRELTVEGKKVLADSAGFYRSLLGLNRAVLCTSPYLRAKQTAEILASALQVSKREVQIMDSLALGADVDELLVDIAALAEASDISSIVLVGHQPDLVKLALELCAEGLQGRVDIERGCILEIAFDELLIRKAGQLVAYHSLRSLGKPV